MKPRRHAGGQYREEFNERGRAVDALAPGGEEGREEEFNERGRAVDALAPGGEEGRDKPRKTPARCK